VILGVINATEQNVRAYDLRMEGDGGDFRVRESRKNYLDSRNFVQRSEDGVGRGVRRT